ncbi:MAG: hypothetical protein C5B49_09180 [Bdellovibrio sp.]|nr:MAG: hypothetical protein C5B49_09180 [Bdellovibrio sp.]
MAAVEFLPTNFGRLNQRPQCDRRSQWLQWRRGVPLVIIAFLSQLIFPTLGSAVEGPPQRCNQIHRQPLPRPSKDLDRRKPTRRGWLLNQIRVRLGAAEPLERKSGKFFLEPLPKQVLEARQRRMDPKEARKIGRELQPADVTEIMDYVESELTYVLLNPENRGLVNFLRQRFSGFEWLGKADAYYATWPVDNLRMSLELLHGYDEKEGTKLWMMAMNVLLKKFPDAKRFFTDSSTHHYVDTYIGKMIASADRQSVRNLIARSLMDGWSEVFALCANPADRFEKVMNALQSLSTDQPGAQVIELFTRRILHKIRRTVSENYNRSHSYNDSYRIILQRAGQYFQTVDEPRLAEEFLEQAEVFKDMNLDDILWEFESRLVFEDVRNYLQETPIEGGITRWRGNPIPFRQTQQGQVAGNSTGGQVGDVPGLALEFLPPKSYKTEDFIRFMHVLLPGVHQMNVRLVFVTTTSDTLPEALHTQLEFKIYETDAKKGKTTLFVETLK